jgi:hypothetical protein
MLDLFCGRWGWSKAFARRGWECVGIDLVTPPDVPEGCTYVHADVLTLDADFVRQFDFVCASSPCEQFSVHGMKHFHPNPPYPELGLKLFNHTRSICEAAGVPYVMENVRAAQQFVGNAVNHCGPFYLWGNSVPPLMNQGIIKGMDRSWNPITRERSAKHIAQTKKAGKKKGDANIFTAIAATIPPELANCVADYAERILEVVA